MPRLISGINFLFLSINLIPVPVSDLRVHAPTTSSQSANSPLSPSITPSLFHSRLKIYLHSQIFPTSPASGLTTRTLRLNRFFSISQFFSLFINLFCLVLCGTLSWLFVGFWAHVNIVSYTIVSCRTREQRMYSVHYFWATVCITLRPVLSDSCPVCPVCLSVTFVHYGQTVAGIKMKLGVQVGLRPGNTVLDGDPAPPPQQEGRAPPFPHFFRPMFIVAKRLDGSRRHSAWR